MATLNLSQPAPFLQSAGDPATPFKAWIRTFENYLLAMSAKELPDARKRALLIHCLGAEGQRLFYTLQVADDTYASALKAIQDFFTPKVNVVAERYRFRQRSQRNGESTLQYVASLRELATTCEFGAMEEEMIRDQLVEKTNSARIRERLLLEIPLTLTKAMQIAGQIETAVSEARAMHHGPQDSAVEAVQSTRPRQNRFQRGRNTPPQPSPTAPQSTPGRACYRCGSTQHIASFEGCPARDALCNSCKRKGHFSKVCRGSNRVSEITESETEEVTETAGVEVTVLGIDDGVRTAEKIMCTVNVSTNARDSQDIELMLDTGSAVSILPRESYVQLFPDSPLMTPKLSLVSYGGNAIPVHGYLQARVAFNDRCADAELYIVQNGSAVLGRDLFTALNMQIVGGKVTLATVNQTNLVTTSVKENTLGCAKAFTHLVKIRPEVKPVQQPLRRLPFSVREAVSQEIKKLVEQDIIEAVEASEWISPIVVTKKKDGGIRLCVDLREPNKAVVIDGYPLPHMEELFAELRGATMFSTLDLQSAYHQVTLHEDSRSLTTFITHDGLFRFKRVPYGLASAPSCFQRMMSLVLKGQSGVQCYLDDIIVTGATVEEHDRNLKAVLKRIDNAGLKLNYSKCHIRKTELTFLGHIVSAKGLQPDASHVEAVSQAPPPTDLITLRSFLGLTGWYQKFVPDYAVVVEPLRALLRGSVPFNWTPEAQQCFEEVKRLIVNSPALSLFNPELPTIVTTDASDYGLGAVLTQIHPDASERTVAFASRTLSQAERKYSTVEKEALGCVWATEKWRTYLWGRHFTIRTDHSPLTTLLSSKGQGRAGMRIARWSARLLSFCYDIQYKPGRENVTADCLSRLPLPHTEPAQEEDAEVVALISTLSAITAAEFKAACASCPVQVKLREILTSRWPKQEKYLDPALRPFFRVQNELSLQNDCVMRGTGRLLVPGSLQPKLISLAHDTHQGIVRTKQRLREVYWWPGMDAQVEAAIKACVTCQSHDKSAVTRTSPLQPVPYPTGAWEKLAIDVVGPFEKAPLDCRFAITLIDYYSKWPEVAFVSQVTSQTVKVFLSTVFSREGNSKELVSDNGSQFVSQEFEAFLQDRGIVHRKSSVYYPRANGEIERFNRSLKDSLQTALLEGKQWKEFVTDFLQAYRSTPHSTTQHSPAELLHGRPMRTKLHVAGFQISQTTPHSPECVAARVALKQSKSKLYTDHRRGAKSVSFPCGSYVRVKKPGILPKTQCRFTKPLKVVAKKGLHTYMLSDGRCWNASYLAPVSPLRGEGDSEFPSVDCDIPVPQPDANASPARPVRLRRAPAWTEDFDI